jgi:hypothetical protein
MTHGAADRAGAWPVAVVGVEHATRLIRDGQHIWVHVSEMRNDTDNYIGTLRLTISYRQ